MRIFVHLETKISQLYDHQTITIIILQEFQAPIVYTANSSSVGPPIGLMCNSKT